MHMSGELGIVLINICKLFARSHFLNKIKEKNRLTAQIKKKRNIKFLTNVNPSRNKFMTFMDT